MTNTTLDPSIDPRAEEQANRLVASVIAGDIEGVRALLPTCEIDRPNEKLMTPITAAGVYGRYEIAWCLIDHGAGLFVKSDLGEPLLWFAGMGWTDLVEHVLGHGVDQVREGSRYQDAFEAASRCNQLGVVRLMIEHTHLSGDEMARSLAMVLGQAGSAEMVNLVVALGAGPNTAGLNGKTALFALAERGSVEVCRQIIGHGADVNWRADDGSTPIFGAVKARRLPVMLALLDAGAVERSVSPTGEDVENLLQRAGSEAIGVYQAWRAQRAMRAVARGVYFDAN